MYRFLLRGIAIIAGIVAFSPYLRGRARYLRQAINATLVDTR